MSTFLFLFFIILCLLISSLIIFKFDLLSPTVITFSLFFISAFCVLLNAKNRYCTYDFKNALIIIFGLISILLTECFVKFLVFKNSKKKIKIQKKQINPSSVLLIAYYTLDIIFLFLFFKKIAAIGFTMGLDPIESISGIKESLEVNLDQFSLFCFDVCYLCAFPAIFVFSYNVSLCKGKILKNIHYLIPLMIAFLAIILRGSRSTIFSLLFSLLYILLAFYKKRTGKLFFPLKQFLLVIVIGIIFVVFFYNIQEIVKGRTSNDNLFEYITYYLGSPIYLFDKATPIKDTIYSGYQYFGVTSFTSLYDFLYKIGLVKYPTTGGSGGLFNYVFFMTTNGIRGGNALTIFYNPYIDFGFVGMIIFIFFFYFFFSFYYYKAFYFSNITHKSGFYIIPYLFLIKSLAFAFYYCGTLHDFRPQTLGFLLFIIIIYKFLLTFKSSSISYNKHQTKINRRGFSYHQ